MKDLVVWAAIYTLRGFVNMSVFGFVIVLACVIKKLWLLSALSLFQTAWFCDQQYFGICNRTRLEGWKTSGYGLCRSFFSHCVVLWPPVLSSVVLLGSRGSPSQSFFHTAWFRDHQYFKLFCPSFTSKNFEKIWFFSRIFFCPLRCFVTTSTAMYYLLVEKTYKSDLFVLCVVAWPPLAVICIDGFFTLPGFMTSSVLVSVIDKALAIGCIDSFFTLRCFVTTSAFIYSSAWLKRLSKPEFLAHCVVSWPPVFQVVLSFLYKQEFWKDLIF